MLYKISEAIGKQIVIFLGLILLYVALFITLKSQIHPSIFYVSLISTILLFVLLQIKTIKVNFIQISFSVLAFLFVVFISFKIAPLYYDFSFDGQGYQQNAVIQLKEGWNPLYDEPLNDLWIDHYAKGNWYIGAVIYSTFNQIELIKAYNILVLFSALFLLIAFFKKININILFNIPLSIVAVANPVTISQLFTTYNDGLIAPMLISMMIILYLTLKEKYVINYFALMAAIIILSNIKFTAFGYAVIVCGIPILYMILTNSIWSWWAVFKEQYVKYFFVAIISFMLAVGFVGTTSYVTNMIDHKHPFYPLAGEGKVDIMTPNMPQSFVGLSWGEKLFRSLFSETGNFFYEPTKLKNPFTIKINELENMGDADTRVAGFGPLFAAALILTLVSTLICSYYIIKRKDYLLLSVFLAMLLTIIINPEAWWMRYVPQLWIVILLLIIVVFTSSKVGKWLAPICLAFLIANVAVVVSVTFYKLEYNKNNLTYQLDILKEYSEENELFIDFHWSIGNKKRFEEYGIQYTELNMNDPNVDPSLCEPHVPVQASTARICAKAPNLLERLIGQ